MLKQQNKGSQKIEQRGKAGHKQVDKMGRLWSAGSSIPAAV
jgi:hypothetical protein